MTRFPRRRAKPHHRLVVTLLAGGWLWLAAVALARAQDLGGASPADSTPAVPAAPHVAWSPDSALAESLRASRFENVSAFRPVAPGDDSGAVITYENRHYRHGATALGRAVRVAGSPSLVYERRLGMVVAAYSHPAGDHLPTQVWYPSEGAFPKPPAGPVLAPTRKSVDLVFDPLFTYETPLLFTRTQVRIDLQTELRYNPWPGGRLRVAAVIPIRNDFQPDSLTPDANRFRPGPVMFEQLGWSPGAALVSACGGLLGNNRYGMSFGIARPLRGGEWLLDGQTDVTGFFATSDSGFSYSTLSRWTGFLGVAYRPPGLDLSVRLRAERFIQGDEGFELEVRRSMGDLDVSLALQRVRTEATNGEPSFGFTNGVVRLTLPIPPTDRPVGWPVRALPVDRFTFNYREESQPIGESVSNLTSREDYLRQADRSSLTSNRPRYNAGFEGRRYRHQEPEIQWVSLTGMTGFINTPWAGVMGDKELEVGYNKIPKEAAYQYRDLYSNEIYYAALGFLPRTEIGLRWTVMPGSRPFEDLAPGSNYVDADRMFSGRFELIEPRPKRPGLAMGIEDARGTRKFHSTYLVTGVPFDIYRLQNRVTLGYAPRVFEASRRTLDGWFGAYEVTAWRTAATAVEYDTEKVNAMLGINLGFGLRARLALLDLKHVGVGAGWFRAL